MDVERLLGEEEIEDFNRNLAEFWMLIEAECEANPEVRFTLYEVLKKARNWGDDVLCRKLKITVNRYRDP